METIKTTYTVIIKKKIEKEVWSVDKWRLNDLENSIKRGYIKNKLDAFKHIAVGNYVNEEIELEKQVYTDLPIMPESEGKFYIKYEGKKYPITNMYLDIDKKTYVMEAVIEKEYIDKVNYNELKKAFDEDYNNTWKKLIENEKHKNKTKRKSGIFFKGYTPHNFFRTK